MGRKSSSKVSVKGKKKLSNELKRLILEVAQFFVDNKSTCRETAVEFELSKTTVHNYLRKFLPYCGNKRLTNQVNKQLAVNKAERAYRGGRATKIRYAELKHQA